MPTKVIIQVPCFNEEATIGATLDALPRRIDGVDRVEWLIVNDGSTDRTVEEALAHGVDHVVDLPVNQGLARAFMAGLQGCLTRGADIIVNTDADNQYDAGDIPALIQPILERRAEIVVGARPIKDIDEFSVGKKLLQRLGSRVVRILSGAKIPDATSGFRAMSRDAAMQLNVFNDYTYTLETIIQAGRRGIAMTAVPIHTNPQTRPSRLIKSTFNFVRRSTFTMLRVFMIYRPFLTFFTLGCIPVAGGALLAARWVWLYFAGSPSAHVPSLILAAVLVLSGMLAWLTALVGELQSINRRLLEDIQLAERRLHFASAFDEPPSAAEVPERIDRRA